MKYVLLLGIFAALFLDSGIFSVDFYNFDIEAVPATGHLPQLTCVGPDGTTRAHLFIRQKGVHQRELTYSFLLPSGTYTSLRWKGYGIALPGEISIRDSWRHEVARIKTNGTDEDDLLSHSNPAASILVLSPTNIGAVKFWYFSHGWPFILSAIIFYLADVCFRRFPAFERLFSDSDGSRRPFLKTQMALLPIWIVLLLPYSMRSEAADDGVMDMLASGYVTGHPSEFLVFIQFIPGLILKALYLAVPHFPWYAVLETLLLVVCLEGITYSIIRFERISHGMAWMLLFNCAFGYYMLSHLQFTPVAYTTVLLGLVIFVEFRSVGTWLLALVFILFGTMIRVDVVIPAMVVGAIPACLLCRRTIPARVLFIVAICLVPSGTRTLNTYYYSRTPGWAHYLAYIGAVGTLPSTPKLDPSPANDEVFHHVGWTLLEKNMFAEGWLYQDKAAFDFQTISYLADHLTSNRSVAAAFAIMIFGTLIASPAAAAVFIYVIIHFLWVRRIPSFSFIFLTASTLAIFLFLSLGTRLPGRVSVPAMYLCSVLSLVACTRELKLKTAEVVSSTQRLVLISCGALFLEAFIFDSYVNRRNTDQIENEMQALTQFSGSTLVSPLYALPFSKLSPFTAVSELRKLDIIFPMWLANSPSLDLALRNHGETALFPALSSNPRFLLVVPTWYSTLGDDFSQYMLERYGTKIRMEPARLPDGKAAVFPDFTVMKAVSP